MKRTFILFLFLFGGGIPGTVFVRVSASPSESSAYEVQNPAQKVSGHVLTPDGLPAVGASIVVRGTTRGTLTDSEGNFSIDAAPRDVLQISFLGYEMQELVVGAKTDFTIELVENKTLIEDVVITGYGNPIKKQSLTGAISSIGASKLGQSAATHATTALAGKIAGVNFRQTDGRPGRGTTIGIRGLGTPLYIIDGLHSNEGAFNNLDFNDIESISILKDASAAIYGLEAGNGVVVVQTKSGKNATDTHTVSFNGYYGSKSWFRFPKPADAETFVRAHIQSDVIQGRTPTYTLEDLEGYRNGTKRSYNWYDMVVNKHAPQNYAGVNVSGKSGKVNYYIALSRTYDENTIHNYGEFERYNAQFNVDIQLTKKLKVGARFNGRIEQDKHPGVPGDDDVWQAIFAIYRNIPTKGPYANDNPMYPQITSNVMSSNFAILNYDISGYYSDKVRVGQLALNAEYELVDGLKLTGMLGYYLGDRFYNNQEYLYKLYSYDPATNTYPVAYELTNPFRERIVNMEEQVTGQAQLIYGKTFGKHTVGGVLVGEFFRTENPGFLTWSRPAANSITYIDYNSLEKYDDYRKRETARVGFATRLNYNYDNRYLFEFAGRYDGSWRFKPGNRWGFFPSGSFGWHVSEEHFWKNAGFSKVFSNLKFRVSYGMVGQDDLIGPFEYLSGYNYGSGGAVLDGANIVGAAPRGLPVTNISWLKIKLFNVGVDFGFFDNRLSGSIDYFQRKADGLKASRYDVLIPNEAGFSLPEENLNSDMFKGFDGQITWHDKVRDFNYSIGATFTYSRKYDWHQYLPRFGNSWHEYRSSLNERFANITWGYLSDGQFRSWEEIAGYPVDIDGQGNTTLRPGDIKYKDLNGDGVINNQDERPIGYARGSMPNLNFGLNFTADWKGIDIAMDFTGGAFGTYNINYELSRPFWDGGNSGSYILGDQWRLSDISDPASRLIPGKYPTALEGNTNHSNYWTSDFWYTNVAYLKLKNFELGYTFPRKWFRKVGITKLRAYLFGQNLFSIDNLNDLDIDPEITSEAGLNYPTNRMYGAGIKLTF
ncbi:MAG TPA: TonB-dependent receptor [Alistipes onderdonkii]|jgi:TonB-linked SusC/RagA family outer membrane protein|nr:TonB-dependent receptor [Alistipes onderdonkii]HJF90393.1 TonB-dependent receptor [Alistipes onderdonkii]